MSVPRPPAKKRHDYEEVQRVVRIRRMLIEALAADVELPVNQWPPASTVAILGVADRIAARTVDDADLT